MENIFSLIIFALPLVIKLPGGKAIKITVLLKTNYSSSLQTYIPTLAVSLSNMLMRPG